MKNKKAPKLTAREHVEGMRIVAEEELDRRRQASLRFITRNNAKLNVLSDFNAYLVSLLEELKRDEAVDSAKSQLTEYQRHDAVAVRERLEQLQRETETQIYDIRSRINEFNLENLTRHETLSQIEHSLSKILNPETTPSSMKFYTPSSRYPYAKQDALDTIDIYSKHTQVEPNDRPWGYSYVKESNRREK